MNNSNETGRFSRTAREEFGYDIEFGAHKGDRLVGLAASFIWGMLVGLWIGGILK